MSISGHKTGFYLDQRSNRLALMNFVSDDTLTEERGHRILNLFSYTGGFGIARLKGGFGLPGYVVNVDASRDALVLAEENFKLNFNRQSDFTWRNRTIQIASSSFKPTCSSTCATLPLRGSSSTW